MAIINGEKIQNAVGISVDEYVKSIGCHSERVAVELNGKILPKSEFRKTLISDSDRIEIVAFVGGG